MKLQFIFGPALLIVGCWCLYVWQGNDAKRLLSGFEYSTMQRENKELDQREAAAAEAKAEGAPAPPAEKAESFVSQREELKTKWDAVQVKRRSAYLIAGGSATGLGALLLLWGFASAGRSAHARKERAHRRENTHHHTE